MDGGTKMMMMMMMMMHKKMTVCKFGIENGKKWRKKLHKTDFAGRAYCRLSLEFLYKSKLFIARPRIGQIPVIVQRPLKELKF
jgi:hypothetical protein